MSPLLRMDQLFWGHKLIGAVAKATCRRFGLLARNGRIMGGRGPAYGPIATEIKPSIIAENI